MGLGEGLGEGEGEGDGDGVHNRSPQFSRFRSPQQEGSGQSKDVPEKLKNTTIKSYNGYFFERESIHTPNKNKPSQILSGRVPENEFPIASLFFFLI